jgi:hypothetical protein
MPHVKHSDWLVIIGTVLLSSAPLHAAVADSASNGFTVKLELNIQAPPQEVYGRLVHNVGDWWNSMHTFSGDAHNLSIDDKAMGCFCEKLADGGSVRHLEVVNADPGKALVLTGALGPLQSIAAAGSLSIRLSAAGNGTKLAVVYAVAGYLPTGMNAWAAPVDSVLTEQFTRLKSLVETGKAGK